MPAPVCLSLGAVLAACVATSALAAPPRIVSLDQCADQYVLALEPRADIVGLSTRARNTDSYLAGQARGLPRRRATTESILAARPTIAVRYWGGDPRLVADLRRRGVKVVEIDDAIDFPGVRANVRKVAAALDRHSTGEGLIAAMDARLAASAGAWRGAGALYLTSGGDTSAGGTLIDAMMRAAGLTNLAPGQGWRAVSLERLVLSPPSAIVEGFFDVAADAYWRWSIARQGALRRVTAHRTLVALPGAILGCPAWFAADGTSAIARAKG